MRRGRVRLVVGLVAALAIVVPLGWMWWQSRLPSSYSVMDMGYVDPGRVPDGASGHGSAHHGSGRHGSDAVSVTALDTRQRGAADVVVDLSAREGTIELASGQEVEGYTLNGSSPGPVIRATVGDLVEVRLHNDDVAGGVALHWHGVDVPNAQDGVAGVTQDAVAPGQDHTYRWVAPAAGTYWYHSHQMSHEQVTGGLLGGIVIEPRRPDPGVLDVLAVTHLYRGTQTVNGDSRDRSVVAEAGRRVRVRLVSTDNGGQLSWANVPFRVAAVDGVEVYRPEAVTDRHVEVPAGGRADLLLTVPEDGSAARVETAGGPALLIGPRGSRAPSVEQPQRRVDLLDYGTGAPTGVVTGRADREFDYSIDRKPGFVDGRPGLWWSINGHLYPDMPMMTVREGEVVRMRISNHSGKSHPMHLHGHHAVVVSRDGKPVTGSPWWFDSLEVRDDETFVIALVADNPGIWMDHCHNLEHAAQGMVTHLMYDGVTTPYRLGEDSGNSPE